MSERYRSGPDGARLRRTAAGLWAAGIIGATSGCSSATLQSAEGFRAANRENVGRLAIGMPRDEVISIMGTESLRPLGTEGSGTVRTAADTMGVQQIQIPLGARGPTLYNPMRTVTFEQVGQHWEVLFYYTRLVEDDGVVSDDEMTPIVLLDGYLAGIGWQFWRDTARSEGLGVDPGSPEG